MFDLAPWATFDCPYTVTARMALQLHQKLLARLREQLAEAIRVTEAANGMFIEYESGLVELLVAEQSLPKTGQLHDRLVTYIDEFPLTEFVRQTLGYELWLLNKYIRDVPSLKLTEIVGYGDADAVAERLVLLFDSLPWEYTLTLELPELFCGLLLPSQDEYAFSNWIRIVRANAAFAERYPLQAENGDATERILSVGQPLLLVVPESEKWNTEHLYVQFDVTGFVGQYGGQAVADVERTLRAILGLGIGVRLFEYEQKVSAFPVASARSYFYVHKRSADGSWKLHNKLGVHDRGVQALEGIKFHTLDGKLDTEEKRARWTAGNLYEMKTVFSAGAKADQIVLAAQWLLDSYLGQDPLLNYVQAMVVLEILLGDVATSEEAGLGLLMRNRCAYLIGKGHVERAQLLSDFARIYKVRSQIVHRGKHRLTRDERVLFRKLRWMCRRVIQEEVNLLIADQKAAS